MEKRGYVGTAKGKNSIRGLREQTSDLYDPWESASPWKEEQSALPKGMPHEKRQHRTIGDGPLSNFFKSKKNLNE